MVPTRRRGMVNEPLSLVEREVIWFPRGTRNAEPVAVKGPVSARAFATGQDVLHKGIVGIPPREIQRPSPAKGAAIPEYGSEEAPSP